MGHGRVKQRAKKKPNKTPVPLLDKSIGRHRKKPLKRLKKGKKREMESKPRGPTFFMEIVGSKVEGQNPAPLLYFGPRVPKKDPYQVPE